MRWEFVGIVLGAFGGELCFGSFWYCVGFKVVGCELAFEGIPVVGFGWELCVGMVLGKNKRLLL